MTTQNYTLHTFAIGAFFALGNAIILMPNFNLFSLLLSLGLTLPILLLTNFLLKRGQKNKIIFFCITTFFGIIALYGAVAAFVDYIKFLKIEQMPQTNLLLTVIVFAAIVIFFAANKNEVIYKYCLFIFAVAIAIMLLCFIGGIKFFDYASLKQNLFKLSFSTKDFLRLFSSVAVLPFMVKDNGTNIKPIFCGVTVGFLLLGVAAFQTALTLGASANVAYPYLKSISVISSGSLFTRLDGIVWFLFFSTAFIKISICIKTVIKSTREILLPT